MLALDAAEDAPEIYAVLTAREHLTRADCTVHLRQLRKRLRLIWPQVRWATTVEFQRRGALHLNLLVKGVPAAELDRFHAALTRLWCERVDALPGAQWSDLIADAEGVVRYISLHFLKSVQAPAIGWKGHRFSASRDYLVRPAAVMRPEARASLKVKRALHAGKSLELAEHEAAHPDGWKFVQVGPGEGRDHDQVRADAARHPFRRGPLPERERAFLTEFGETFGVTV